MIERIVEMLSSDFLLHHALYGTIAVGFVVPLAGVYIVLRRLLFWGVALPQVSAAGLAFAYFLQAMGVTWLSGEGHEKHLAILVSFVATSAAVLGLAWLERRRTGVPEARVGVLYSAAAALAILLVAFNATGESEMANLLRGEIVTLSEHDFHLMLDVFVAATATLLLFHREFLLVSYDRDMAVTLGRSVLLWDVLLYLIVGLTISIGVMVVGPLVIFGFLVIPPMAARPWARGVLSMSLLASAFGGLSAFVGFYFSYAHDGPVGPIAVLAACATLVLSTVTKVALTRPRKAARLGS